MVCCRSGGRHWGPDVWLDVRQALFGDGDEQSVQHVCDNELQQAIQDYPDVDDYHISQFIDAALQHQTLVDPDPEDFDPDDIVMEVR